MHSQRLPMVLLVILALVGTGLAIKCYECNSYDDANCGDPFNAHSAGHLITDCSQKIRPIVGGKPVDYTFCRKTSQKASLSGLEKDDSRVVRQCGYLNDTRLEPEAGEEGSLKCYRRVGTYAVELYYCTCYEDECNAVGKVTPGNLATAITLGLFVIGAGLRF